MASDERQRAANLAIQSMPPPGAPGRIPASKKVICVEQQFPKAGEVPLRGIIVYSDFEDPNQQFVRWIDTDRKIYEAMINEGDYNVIACTPELLQLKNSSMTRAVDNTRWLKQHGGRSRRSRRMRRSRSVRRHRYRNKSRHF